jgi:hypothetical protein
LAERFGRINGWTERLGGAGRLACDCRLGQHLGPIPIVQMALALPFWL